MREVQWQDAKAYVLGRLDNELSPLLTYHGSHHTRDDVLPAAERLAKMVNLSPADALLLKTAALYHDIGFIEQYTQNESIAVRIATETLPGFGYSQAQIQSIAKIILATQMPQIPHSLLEELICDGDLDSLGRQDFFITSHSLFHELQALGAKNTLAEWYRIQLKFLEEHQYFTEAARSLRQSGKMQNILALKKRMLEMGA